MEAEKLIISKKYYELTSAELEVVTPLVSGEVEFDEMKAFLVATQSTFESQKIINTPELDNKIFAQLNSTVSTNRTWYNSLILFLFPRDRRVYQYPAFQLAIATVLIFGVFNVFNFDNLKNDNSMAYEDHSIEKGEKNMEELLILEEVSEVEESKMPNMSNDSVRFGLSSNVIENSDIDIENVGYFKDDNYRVKDLVMEDDQNTYEYSVSYSDEISIDDTFDEKPIMSPTVEGNLKKEVIYEMSDNEMGSSNGIVAGAVMTEEKAIEEEEQEEYVIVNSLKEDGADNDRELKKKDKNRSDKFSSAPNKSNAYKSEVDAVSQVADESKKMPEKVSIKSTPELQQLFFEVK